MYERCNDCKYFHWTKERLTTDPDNSVEGLVECDKNWECEENVCDHSYNGMCTFMLNIHCDGIDDTCIGYVHEND